MTPPSPKNAISPTVLKMAQIFAYIFMMFTINSAMVLKLSRLTRTSIWYSLSHDILFSTKSWTYPPTVTRGVPSFRRYFTIRLTAAENVKNKININYKQNIQRNTMEIIGWTVRNGELNHIAYLSGKVYSWYESIRKFGTYKLPSLFLCLDDDIVLEMNWYQTEGSNLILVLFSFIYRKYLEKKREIFDIQIHIFRGPWASSSYIS